MRRFFAIILTVVCLCLLAACGAAPSTDMDNQANQYQGLVDDSNTAYVLCEKSGTAISVPNARQAYVTRDRKSLIWVSVDNDLNCAAFDEENTDLTKAEKMAEDVSSILRLNDSGLCYKDTNGDLCLFGFADKSGKHISSDVDDFSYSLNLDIVYAANGAVYSRSHDSETADKIGTYSGSVDLYVPASDISNIIWVDSDLSTEKDTVYYHHAGETKTVGELSNGGSDYATYLRSEGKIALCYSSEDNSVFIFPEGKDFVKVSFSGNISKVSTDLGIRSSLDEGDANGLFVLVKNDQSGSLYWTSLSGDKERLLTDVRDFLVSGETLFYLTQDKHLYKTSVSGIKTSEGEKIDDEVDAITSLYDSGIVFYMKDGEETAGSSYNAAGTLYAYKATDKDPVKIDSNVYMTLIRSVDFALDSAFCNLNIQDLGNSVLYLKNPENYNYSAFGSLYLYKYGDKEPVRIFSDVKQYPITNTKLRYSSDSFIFARYIDEESHSASIYDWYYYNGEDVNLIAEHCKY